MGDTTLAWSSSLIKSMLTTTKRHFFGFFSHHIISTVSAIIDLQSFLYFKLLFDLTSELPVSALSFLLSQGLAEKLNFLFMFTEIIV